MNRVILGATALAALAAAPGAALAQGFTVGPGGVRIDDGRRGYYEERRGPSPGQCRDLRRACLYKDELGDEGRGNCRRYRRLCT